MHKLIYLYICMYLQVIWIYIGSCCVGHGGMISIFDNIPNQEQASKED